MPAPLLAAAAIPAVGSLVGGILGNRANRKEAKRNRKFQERMRNTQWQAGVADMEKAGINPAVAYSQGGAASPSGSQASQEDVVSPAVSSAQEGRRVKAQLDLVAAQTATQRNVARKEGAAADFSEATNLAYGFSRDENGSIRMNFQMPNLFDLIGSQVSSARSLAEFNRLSLPGARNIAGFEGGRAGQSTRSIRTLLQSIFGSGGAFRAR